MTAAAEQLRRSVGKDDQAAVADLLKKLRELDSDKVFSDPAQFERLQTQAADAVKRFEFNLRRKTELKGNEVLLSGDGEYPRSSGSWSSRTTSRSRKARLRAPSRSRARNGRW